VLLKAPVLIGYDGSEFSRAAVRHASELFAGRPAVVATAWEPGLRKVPVALPGTMTVSLMAPDPDTLEQIDREQREPAVIIAADGAALARCVGLVAEPQAVPDHADVADTLITMARRRDVAVIVVGSRGISGLRRHLLGGVSRKLIKHSDRPVLVTRDSST
jgi:nucleotide-binding universal stress UspA family protein